MRPVAFLFGLVSFGAVVAVGQFVVPGLAAPAAFGLLAALLLGGRRWVPGGYAFTLAIGILTLWFLGQPTGNMAGVFVPFVPLLNKASLGLFAVALLWTALRLRRAPRPVVLSLPGLALIFVLSLLVAALSGNAGGSAPMGSWLVETLRLTPEQAHVIVVLFRKTVHFVFYATVGFGATAAARSGGEEPRKARLVGLGYGFLLAAFDELRQTGAVARTGSAWDVGLDMLGVLAGGALALRASSIAKQS
ncbi:MAG: VanZ family protein [Fimbriimonas sp.]